MSKVEPAEKKIPKNTKQFFIDIFKTREHKENKGDILKWIIETSTKALSS